jgi:hypothetical protein
MSKTTFKHFTPKQKRELKKIQKGPNQVIDLTAFAAKYGMNYRRVYAKWCQLLRKKSPLSGVMKKIRTINTPAAVTNTPATNNAVIPTAFTNARELTAYTLVDAQFGHGRISKNAGELITDKLDPLVNALQPDSFCVPFHKENRSIVRKWLSKKERKNKAAYTIVPIRGNKKMLAIQRTA